MRELIYKWIKTRPNAKTNFDPQFVSTLPGNLASLSMIINKSGSEPAVGKT